MSKDYNEEKSRKNNKKYTLPTLLSSLFFMAVGFVSATLLYPTIFKNFSTIKNSESDSQKSERQAGVYKFINPLLECEFNRNVYNKNMVMIETEAKQTVDGMLKNGNATSISIYYRDLNNGPWFGINESENYKPASLLKVPVFIAYLKKIDNRMDLLKSTVSFDENELDLPEPAQGLTSLEPGTGYTLENLFERMVLNSDNQAYTLLVNRIDTSELDEVMIELGMTVPDENQAENILTAKSYASLFRVLYNASYLSRNTSEYALSLMSRARYDRGLTKELPVEVAVSHKYGLRTDENKGGEIYLHDCGIIYYPEKPYLLCVMTKGSDYDKLSDVISTLSSTIYKKMKTQ